MKELATPPNPAVHGDYTLLDAGEEPHEETGMKDLINRLKEPSTYAGLGVLLASLGWMDWAPEDWNTVFVGISGIFGVVALFVREKATA